MTPRAYHEGGRDMPIRYAPGTCAMGAILVAASARGVCDIALGDDPHALVNALKKRFPNAALAGGSADFDAIVAQVIRAVDGRAAGRTLSLDVRGTTFQLRVWQALSTVPPGQTVSYTEIARRIGTPRAVRAVATACAANTLAVVVPCHRAVRSDGSLSGYRWGVARKRMLLQREAQAAATVQPGPASADSAAAPAAELAGSDLPAVGEVKAR